MRTKTIRVSVHPRVSTSFHADERVLIDELESRLERTIRLESRSDFHIEHFEISAIDQSEMVVGRKITGSAGDR